MDPSAYASGALVKCRKVGAANWGNSSKKEEFSDWKSEFIWEDGDSEKSSSGGRADTEDDMKGMSVKVRAQKTQKKKEESGAGMTQKVCQAGHKSRCWYDKKGVEAYRRRN